MGAEMPSAVAAAPLGPSAAADASVGQSEALELCPVSFREVNRSCTTGHRNVNSMLYAAAWRAAKALGYRRLVTYTRSDESGASLKAAGWRVIAEREPRKGWSCAYMWRADTSTEHNVQRMLWEAP